MDTRDRRWWPACCAPKWLRTLLAGFVLLGLLGCGRGSEVSEERGGSEPSAEHQTEQLTSRESEPEPEPGPESDEGEGHDSGDEHGGEHGSEGEQGEESGESGIRYGVAETAQETRSGVCLELRFDAATETFTGTVVNTAAEPVSWVRVEVHLSNGVELGPTPRISLVSGETSSVRLAAAGQGFETWTTHVEIGEGEHGERHR